MTRLLLLTAAALLNTFAISGLLLWLAWLSFGGVGAGASGVALALAWVVSSACTKQLAREQAIMDANGGKPL